MQIHTQQQAGFLLLGGGGGVNAQVIHLDDKNLSRVFDDPIVTNLYFYEVSKCSGLLGCFDGQFTYVVLLDSHVHLESYQTLCRELLFAAKNSAHNTGRTTEHNYYNVTYKYVYIQENTRKAQFQIPNPRLSSFILRRVNRRVSAHL